VRVNHEVSTTGLASRATLKSKDFLDGALANTPAFFLVEDDEELRTSFESIWSCYLLRAISSQVMSRRLSEVILYF